MNHVEDAQHKLRASIDQLCVLDRYLEVMSDQVQRVVRAARGATVELGAVNTRDAEGLHFPVYVANGTYTSLEALHGDIDKLMEQYGFDKLLDEHGRRFTIQLIPLFRMVEPPTLGA